MALAQPGEREWDYLLHSLDVDRFQSGRIDLVELLEEYTDADGIEKAKRAITALKNGESGRNLHWEAKSWAERVPKGLVQILASSSTVPLGLLTLSEEIPWQDLLTKVLELSQRRLGPLARGLAEEFLVSEEHGHRAAQAALAAQAAVETGKPVSEQYLRYVREQHHSFSEHFVEAHAVTVEEALSEQEEEIYYRLLLDGVGPEQAAAAAKLV